MENIKERIEKLNNTLRPNSQEYITLAEDAIIKTSVHNYLEMCEKEELTPYFHEMLAICVCRLLTLDEKANPTLAESSAAETFNRDKISILYKYMEKNYAL